MTKKYDYEYFDTPFLATYACNHNQNWHVVSVCPTGFNHQVLVVYYINYK